MENLKSYIQWQRFVKLPAMVGNNVSHSKRRTKRTFDINLKTKKFWSEEEQRFVTLKVSCKGMKNIVKNGLDATVKSALKKGYINIL